MVPDRIYILERNINLIFILYRFHCSSKNGKYNGKGSDSLKVDILNGLNNCYIHLLQHRLIQILLFFHGMQFLLHAEILGFHPVAAADFIMAPSSTIDCRALHQNHMGLCPRSLKEAPGPSFQTLASV